MRGSRHTSLSVQLGKHMLSMASSERVPITDQYHTESNAPFVKDRGPKRGMYNQIGEKSGVGGGRYVTNVCMYAALFRLYSGISTQTARRRAHQRRRRESIPRGATGPCYPSCSRIAASCGANCSLSRAAGSWQARVCGTTRSSLTTRTRPTPSATSITTGAMCGTTRR